MLEISIRTLSVLLLIGAGLHAWGSFVSFRPKTPERVWSLGAAGFAALLAALGWLLAGRNDPELSWIVAAGCLGWLVTVGAFGRAIGNIADPRVLYHLVVGMGLAITVLL